MPKKLIIAFCLFRLGAELQAQESLSALGGNATGSGGTLSCTVGQVAYTTNIANSGTITQGVQQPFEILIVTGIEDTKSISLECLVYPNPATVFVKLKIENYNKKNLIYQLYDMNGKLIRSKKVESNETNISMENLVPSTYFLKVTDKQKEVKIFKIIKN